MNRELNEPPFSGPGWERPVDAKREQFVRMMGEVVSLLRQARTAASLAPRRELLDEVSALMTEAKRLMHDDAPWFFGQDSRGRMVTEAGQVVEKD